MVMTEIMTQVSVKVYIQPEWRRRIAKGKVVTAKERLKEAGGKSVGRRTGMPRTQKVEGRQIRGEVRPGRVRNTG